MGRKTGATTKLVKLTPVAPETGLFYLTEMDEGVGIWPNPPEGQAPLPSHPIALPGDPWWGDNLHPEHPIVIPPDGETPPDTPPPAKLDCRWTYTDEGWVLFCKAGPYDKPRPVGGGR